MTAVKRHFQHDVNTGATPDYGQNYQPTCLMRSDGSIVVLGLQLIPISKKLDRAVAACQSICAFAKFVLYTTPAAVELGIQIAAFLIMAIPGSSVRYSKITNAIDLFDDSYTSAIWCCYCGNPQRCLGVRYNGADDSVSFPNKDGYPLWYIEPDFVTRSILLDIIAAINTDPAVGDMNNVLTALREFDGR